MSPQPEARINLNHLRHNAALVKQLAPHSKLLAMVKANAYGHGVHEVARALELADGFAVARYEEACALRQTQLDKPVLVLGGAYHAHELEACLQQKMDVVVHQDEQFHLLCRHKSSHHTKIVVWLKIDTGMHRLGIAPEKFTYYFQQLSALPFVSRVVAMTHFASADEINNTFTQTQIDVFRKATSGIHNLETSLANSAAIIHWPGSHANWVRPGLMLYGINPNPASALDLRPVMTLTAPVVALNEVPVGDTVGYNQTWRATRKSLVATVCHGYGDGYPTQIKPGTPVLLHGKRVPIVGRVSMDLITIDITDVPQTRIGDKVIFWGEDEHSVRLPVEEIAKCAGTIPYDLVTRIGKRVQYMFV